MSPQFSLELIQASKYYFSICFECSPFIDISQTSGNIAKVGKETHRSYRFADLPWSRHVKQGDTAEVLFYAKTWRRIRGLKATVTQSKAYPERPCLRTCGTGSYAAVRINADWYIRTSVLYADSSENRYHFNDYYTLVVNGQHLTAASPVSCHLYTQILQHRLALLCSTWKKINLAKLSFQRSGACQINK